MTDHEDRRLDQADLPGIERGAPVELRPSWGRRAGIVAATVALGLGAVALADQRGDGEGEDGDPDGEEDARLELEPVVLDLAGPWDGNESIGLVLQVEPSTGLADGQRITVTGGGFIPGESVGIVQCAEALADQPGDAVESCDIGNFVSATANSDGIATGTWVVRRSLTTPRSGTVDCLAEVGRCVVAMGALDDYDRSGVHQILLGEATPPGGPPAAVEQPTARVTPTLGLADGDTVRLEGEGFTPGVWLDAELCSVDPAVCWTLGPPVPGQEDPAVLVDADGRVGADLQVWRYLPGPTLGSYVDCAISRCQLRLEGDRVPEPIALGYLAGGAPPTGGAIAIEPDDDLAPGDPVTITGAGFTPGDDVFLELCAALAADPDEVVTCVGAVDGGVSVGDDGRFTVATVVPALDPRVVVDTTTCGTDPGQCQGGPTSELDIRCDGVETTCTLRASISSADVGYGRPAFGAVPVPVTFRPPTATG